MRLAVCLQLAASVFVATSTCEAGDFFRRAPDVGEWARYEHAASFTNNIDSPCEHTDEFKGTLLLTCVGEEMVEEQRHLWIECRQEFIDSTGYEHWSVHKVLVPEEHLLAGTLTTENVRGWKWSMAAEDVEPLDFSKGWDWMELSRFLGPDPEASSGRMDDRTIVVDEVEVQLSYAESAPLPSQEVGSGTQSGEITWWPDADLAFGIASVHYNLRTDSDAGVLVTRGHLSYDLVATGTDAVSELPDHN